MSVLFRTWVDLLKCLSPVSRVGQRYRFSFWRTHPSQEVRSNNRCFLSLQVILSRIKYLVSLGFLSFEVLCVSCPFSEVILSLISDYFMFTYYQVLEVTPDSDFNHVCSVVCIFHWKDLKTMIVNPIYCNQLKLDA